MPVDYLNCRRDPLRLDPEKLASLFIEVGEQQAHYLVGRAMCDLDAAMQTVRTEILRTPNVAVTQIDRIEHLAETLGLAGLARVAADVADLCDGDDGIALAATLDRMERLVEQAQRMVWTLGDLSGA